jgi:hypothetical protein
MAISMLDTGEERCNTQLLGHVVVGRRLGDVAVCIVGDTRLDTDAVQRKLNVVAIRFSASASSAPVSPLVSELRDAYVSVTMPLSGRIFDRAMDDLRRAHRVLDVVTLRPFVEQLASTLTPPSDKLLRDRAEPILRRAEQSVRSDRSSAPASGATTPPKTLAALTAVQAVVRGVAGPMGDLLVHRALQELGSQPDAVSTERVLLHIADALPFAQRTRFLNESRAALRAAGALAG